MNDKSTIHGYVLEEVFKRIVKRPSVKTRYGMIFPHQPVSSSPILVNGLVQSAEVWIISTIFINICSKTGEIENMLRKLRQTQQHIRRTRAKLLRLERCKRLTLFRSNLYGWSPKGKIEHLVDLKKWWTWISTCKRSASILPRTSLKY